MKITHALHTQILCGFQSHYPPNSKSPSWKIGPRCSLKACIKHSGNAQAVIRGTPGRGREENARSIVSHLMRLPKMCSPNHRTSDSGNALQWREDNRCVSSKAGAWREDDISCTYSDILRLPIACSPNNRTVDSGIAVQCVRRSSRPQKPIRGTILSPQKGFGSRADTR